MGDRGPQVRSVTNLANVAQSRVSLGVGPFGPGLASGIGFGLRLEIGVVIWLGLRPYYDSTEKRLVSRKYRTAGPY